MSPIWEGLLEDAEERVLPWVGPRRIGDGRRVWRLAGDLPPEHGWYRFRTKGRTAEAVDLAEPDPALEEAFPVVRGTLVGDRLIPDDARVDPDPRRLVEQTHPVHLVEPGLERFSRAATIRLAGGELVWMRPEFPLGPEDEVLAAYQDRRPDLDHVRGVPPALDLAFRWVSRERRRAEEREARRQARLDEERRRREAEERLREEVEELRRDLQAAGTGAARRALARHDFAAAARAALAISGAVLLDVREAYGRSEMVVQYRFRHRRFECVVDRETLRVVDAGICLTDERTGERGDDRFTLESLPAVVAASMDRRELVVYRHV